MDEDEDDFGITAPAEPVMRLGASRLPNDAGSALTAVGRDVAVEVPVSFTYNGMAHAVMMATPLDLEDFAVGFSLTQKIACEISEIRGVMSRRIPQGILIQIDIPAERFSMLASRRRNVVGQTGCGLCGIVELEQALLPLEPISEGISIGSETIFAALEALSARQPLQRATGAMHAAGFFSADGEAIAIREDVGRHNALDKLIGSLAREGRDASQGFAVITSRCSYELVEKTVIARIPILVTISAPTSLAVERAKEAGLTLVSLARSDNALIMNDPHGRIRRSTTAEPIAK